MARLAHRGEKEAVVALPETWLGEARKSRATVRLWSDRDRSFDARLRELSPQADPATRTYAARFTIADADDSVAFGMTATVTLSRRGRRAAWRGCRSRPSSTAAPGRRSMSSTPSGALVLRPVTVASFTEEAALVTSGIDDGEKVVTLGVQKLEAGLKVRAFEAR